MDPKMTPPSPITCQMVTGSEKTSTPNTNPKMCTQEMTLEELPTPRVQMPIYQTNELTPVARYAKQPHQKPWQTIKSTKKNNRGGVKKIKRAPTRLEGFGKEEMGNQVRKAVVQDRREVSPGKGDQGAKPSRVCCHYEGKAGRESSRKTVC